MSPWTYAIQVEFANYREEQEIWRILQEAGIARSKKSGEYFKKQDIILT